MLAKKSIITQLRRMMKTGDVDHPRINAIFIQLILADEVTWKPLYQAYLTKKDPGKAGEQEPEPVSAYDREGK